MINQNFNDNFKKANSVNKKGYLIKEYSLTELTLMNMASNNSDWLPFTRQQILTEIQNRKLNNETVL